MAAKERLISAMDYANRLRPHQLSGFWLFPSKVCFAIIGSFGALLAATSPAEEECAFYKARLREYRWTLGMAGKDAGWLRHASKTMEEQMATLDAMEHKSKAKDLAEQLQRLQADEVKLVGERAFEARGRFNREDEEAMEEDEDEDEEEEDDGEEAEEDDDDGEDDAMAEG